jgi:hypothetical protein
LGTSLLIYQHFARVERDMFIRTLAVEIMRRTGSSEVLSLRTAHTVFFLVMQDAHREPFTQSAAAISQRRRDQIDILQHTSERVTPIRAGE